MPLELGEEDGHQLLLLLDPEAAELELNLLEVAHEHDEELEGRVHRQLAEHDRRGIEGEFHLDLVDVELFEVNLLLLLCLAPGLVVGLLEVGQGLLDLVDVVDSVLVVVIQLIVAILHLVLASLL